MILEISQETDYYNVGNQSDIFISQSALKKIDPDLGGHPRKFLQFFDSSIVRKPTPSMENGTLFHYWLEHQNEFAVATVNKPTEKIGEIADYIIDRIRTDISIEIISETTIFTLFCLARGVIEYYKDRSNESTWGTFSKSGAIPYIEFAITNKDKIVLTVAQEALLQLCQESIKLNEAARSYLFENGFNRIVHKELTVFWTSTTSVRNENGDEIPLKHKIRTDRFIIDHENKQLIIIDNKTHGKGSAFNYAPRTTEQLVDFKTPFERAKVYLQFAMYKVGLLEIEEIRLLSTFQHYEWKYKLIVTETTDLVNTYVFDIDFTWITKGIYEIHQLENRVAFHIKHNKWDRQMEELTYGLELKTVGYAK
jgi:hypothetical protein